MLCVCPWGQKRSLGRLGGARTDDLGVLCSASALERTKSAPCEHRCETGQNRPHTILRVENAG